MSWLDAFFSGVTEVQVAGSPLPAESTINFVGGVTGTDDPINGRSIINIGVAFSGGGSPVSGALGVLPVNSYLTIDLSTQDSTASLPVPTADSFIAITFIGGYVSQPHKCTISSGSANIDASITPYNGLQSQVQFSNTGSALLFWNNSKSEWIQQ
jgi:hypothetical protein